jgi:hypothetical protein
MKNLKSRDQFLMEKLEVSLITEAGIQSNNAKWSETMIGKLFNWVFRVITLDGYLVDKFKDLFGAKSFFIKNLAKRLEKAIDALPGEYVKRNEEIDFKNLEMQYYDELYNLIDMMNKSKDVPIGKIHEKIGKCLSVFKQISSELDSKDVEQSKVIKQIEDKVSNLEKVFAKTSEIVTGMTEEEADSKTGYGLSKMADKLGNKNDVKRDLDELKATLLNSIKDGKDDAKLSTESMFKIVSIMNKARDLYMEEDREGETVYRGNKRETVFKPNKRLFNLWEEKVLGILSRKSSIIPNKLLSYINNSLASVDPVKYNFEVEPGVEKNVLDELSDIDRAMGRATKKFGKGPKTPVDLMPTGKSMSSVFHLNTHKRIQINQKSTIRAMISFNVKMGSVWLLNEDRSDDVQHGLNDKSVVFIPTRTYVNGMVLGVMSFSPTVFDNAVTSAKANISVKDLEFKEDFWRDDPHYYWAVLNKKDLTENGGAYIMRIFNPGVTVTNDRLVKQDSEDLYEKVVINKLGEIKVVYGNDDKVAEIDKNYLEKKFNFNSTGYKSINNYFEANKF